MELDGVTLTVFDLPIMQLKTSQMIVRELSKLPPGNPSESLWDKLDAEVRPAKSLVQSERTL